MKYAIVVSEKLGPTCLYSNRKAAALDPLNGIEVGERQLKRLQKAELIRQENDPNCMFPTGYPFSINGCTVDRIPIKSTRDVVFPEMISDGHGSEWDADCPSCGAKMHVMRPGDARCSEECWLSE